MDAAAGVSLGLSAVAIGVSLLGWMTNRSAVRAEQADRKQEAADRGRQLELLRRQVESGESAEVAERAARLTVLPTRSGGGERNDTYQFEVTNQGPDVARELRAWAVNDADQTVTAVVEWPAIAAGKTWPLVLEVPRSDARRGGCWPLIAWVDRRGQQRALRRVAAGFSSAVAHQPIRLGANSCVKSAPGSTPQSPTRHRARRRPANLIREGSPLS